LSWEAPEFVIIHVDAENFQYRGFGAEFLLGSWSRYAIFAERILEVYVKKRRSREEACTVPLLKNLTIHENEKQDWQNQSEKIWSRYGSTRYLFDEIAVAEATLELQGCSINNWELSGVERRALPNGRGSLISKSRAR